MKTVIVFYNQTEEEFNYYIVESEFAKLVRDGEVIHYDDEEFKPFLHLLFQHRVSTKEQFLQAAKEGCDITHIVYV